MLPTGLLFVNVKNKDKLSIVVQQLRIGKRTIRPPEKRNNRQKYEQAYNKFYDIIRRYFKLKLLRIFMIEGICILYCKFIVQRLK